ncbi:MAG: hypothetical protein AAFR59_10645 [Bacteroidota bacterium]
MEHVHSGRTDYKSYELNLVLKDARRIQIVDHTYIQQIRTDAAQLRDFLEIPVWD